jgi:death on curing protein
LTEYLDLADYLLIAEAVLGVPAEEIARWPGIGLAESALHAPAAGFGGVELYPD